MFEGRLETFLKVAESGSFTKASEELYITPTAVMKQINSLENELSVSLFARTNRGLTLTKAGESFCADARYILEYVAARRRRRAKLKRAKTESPSA